MIRQNQLEHGYVCLPVPSGFIISIEALNSPEGSLFCITFSLALLNVSLAKIDQVPVIACLLFQFHLQ
ncbi:MAG TPA: hypothetical protein VE445_06925 [Nitrososphaeraceae archaeon]|nr:hypothetical protein [Nitrososphaeraceae archaeon]